MKPSEIKIPDRYRIMETKLGFFVQERVSKQAGMLWWKEWYYDYDCVLSTKIRHHTSCINTYYPISPFRTLQKAQDYIKKATHYPIYHSVNTRRDINRELYESLKSLDEAMLKHSQTKQSTRAHQPTHDSTTTPPKKNNTKREPFTKEEQEIMDLLVDAHNMFVKIEQSHPDDKREWVDGIHKCQNVLMNRVVVRDYPNVFHKSNQL